MPNHAAYTPDDVEDAKRGRPAVDLASYATTRGLEPLGQALVGHFTGLNPRWPDYVFNVIRGELVPGRFGVVQHELDEVELDDKGEPRQSGSYFQRRSVAKPGLRSLIGLRKEPPNEPFAAQAMWLPTTAIKLLVPETALMPRFVIRSAGHAGFADPKLSSAPSFRTNSSRWVTDAWSDAVGAALGPSLESLPATFVRMELSQGALGVRVDGFRSDPADLDRLVAAMGAMANAFAELGRSEWRAATFEQPLGGFDRDSHPPGFIAFDTAAIAALQGRANELGMTIEDPVALHRRFPHLPMPGTSMGVLAGTLPGTTSFGRLTWQTQAHPESSLYFRPGAIIAAKAEAPRLPVGGRLVKSTEMYVATGDGLACCWTQASSLAKLNAAETAERAVATFREAGVADL